MMIVILALSYEIRLLSLSLWLLMMRIAEKNSTNNLTETDLTVNIISRPDRQKISIPP